MQSIVSRRGRTVVPAAIRTKYKIKDGDQLVWIDDGKMIRVIPIPADPIKALRGSGKGQNLTSKLLEERSKGRARYERHANSWFAASRPGRDGSTAI